MGFGPVEADPLWAEGFEVIEDRLKEGEFYWVLREWGAGLLMTSVMDLQSE